MAAQLVALCIAANDPSRLALFWAGVLGRAATDEGRTLAPSEDGGFRIEFQPTLDKKAGPNQMHLDLTSTSLEDQQQTVERCLELGARHIDIGQRPEEGHVVLADPEGNEFCVIEPGNTFLADCGLIGAINCDGSRETGYFWSQALAWPLVWDHDQETAIQSPCGGTKIAWGGPPVAPKTGKNRLHLHLAPPVHGDQLAGVDRLLSLGATRIDIGQGDVDWAVMADPDGNEFCVLAP
jgi:catechol 2,3-dioxygenase-like lactoylglutathione lyase family enzyme